MGRLSGIYQGVREDASDCWAALCGFRFIHLVDRPRHYDESRRGNGVGVPVAPEEGARLDGQGPKWQPLVTVQPQPEPRPESSSLLQDLQMQNQRDQLMRARMDRGAGEDESDYRSTWMEPGAQAQIEYIHSPTRNRFDPSEGSRSYVTGATLQAANRVNSRDLSTDKNPETGQRNLVSAGVFQSDEINLVRAVTASSAVVYFSGSKEKFEKTRKHKRKRAASLPLEDTTR